jgi:AraC family transcriptional activator of mtrCDE
MNQFIFQQGQAKELHAFPHILEFGLKKINSIQLDSLNPTSTDCVRMYLVLDGKFEWIISEDKFNLYPGDLAVILPGQVFGGEHGILNIGSLMWLHLKVEKTEPRRILFGRWSGLTERDSMTISKILLYNSSAILVKRRDHSDIFQNIRKELTNQEMGYTTRVNQLIDELFICLARQVSRQNNSQRDFPQTFLKLEQTLRQNLAHQWTVEEMAALTGLGATAFNEKVKNYTGFSPLNYLINIRISEAIKLLNGREENVTAIALTTGFYSSQHFATTFKKLTGYTPSEFRKRNLPRKQ